MTWAIAISLLLIPTTALCCHAMAQWMRSRSVGQQIRTLGPDSHYGKAGTPTAGGTVVLLLWGVSVVLLGWIAGWPSHVGFVVACGLGFGSLGLLDDLLSLYRHRSIGLSGWQKVIAGTMLAFLLLLGHREVLTLPQQIPFTSSSLLLPPLGGALLCTLMLLSTTNSANLTDGLDGLAGGVSLLVLIGLLLISPPSSAASSGLILPLVGCLLGFLWLNVYPARLFLGDVGAFGLGGIIGALAWTQGASLLLPLLAGVFVLEAVSVLLQVVILRLTRRRLLKMAPLHHHFEDSRRRHAREHWIPAFTWPEATVTARFLLLQAGFVLLALWAARGGGIH